MGVSIQIGDLRQSGTLSNPGTPVMDGDGTYTQTYTPLDPPVWRFAIEVATVRASEKHFAQTVTGHASYIFSGRYHPDITTQTRVVWTDRAGTSHTGDVLDVVDTDGAGVETVALVSELVP